MKLFEIVENAGFEPERHIEETAVGEKVAVAAARFAIENWESETGDQIGVSYQLLKAVATGGPMDRLYWAGKVSPARRHCWADAQNMY
jgi:hypothetical protein